MMTPLLARAVKRLTEEGIRMTLQRQLILEHLFNRVSHPTAEQLYQSIFEDYPHYVSMTTIYNTLRTLKRHELVREFYIQHDGLSRYDTRMSPHHHLICEQCLAVTDYDVPRSQQLRPEGVGGSFRMTRMYMEISGVCGACEAAEAEATLVASTSSGY